MRYWAVGSAPVGYGCCPNSVVPKMATFARKNTLAKRSQNHRRACFMFLISSSFSERKIEREREIDRDTDKQTDRQTGRQAGRQADRQSERVREREILRQRETERE